MAVLKCKMCGGDLIVIEGATVCECEYCGSKQTVPSLDNEKKINLFTRANRLRAACEFDKAFSVYESIVAEFQEEAEAYWGLILCKYGIEYVDDPKTGKKIPTCHRSSFDSVMEDVNFEMVMEYSDASSRAVYRDEAKAIETLRVGIIEVSAKEEPYDIFICYKETDENGERTIDSVLAQDVYDELINRCYKVFFSRITLEDKLGQEYEPYIFAALNSAKIMLVFGTDYEYFNAVWVKNEWSRFLALIQRGEKKTLIPCYKGVDAYDMPAEFKKLQALDLGKVGAIQDLLRGIEKIMGKRNDENVAPVVQKNNTLTKKGNICLDERNYEEASKLFDKALEENPEDGEAYLGKALSDFKVRSIDELGRLPISLELIPEIEKAVRFTTGDQNAHLRKVYESSKSKESDYKGLVNAVVNGNYKSFITLTPFLWRSMNAVNYDQIDDIFGVPKKVIDDIIFKYAIYNSLRNSDKPLNTKEIIESSSMLSKLEIAEARRLLVDLNHLGIITLNNKCFSVISDALRASNGMSRRGVIKKQIEECKRSISEFENKESLIRREIDEIRANEDSINAKVNEERSITESEIAGIKQEIEEANVRFYEETNGAQVERTRLNDLLNQLDAEMAGLGLFQGKRKRELYDQRLSLIQGLDGVNNFISSRQNALQSILTPKQGRLNELLTFLNSKVDSNTQIMQKERESEQIQEQKEDISKKRDDLLKQYDEYEYSWKPALIDDNYYDGVIDYSLFMMELDDTKYISDLYIFKDGGYYWSDDDILYRTVWYHHGIITKGSIRLGDHMRLVREDGRIESTVVIGIHASTKICSNYQDDDENRVEMAKAGDEVTIVYRGFNLSLLKEGLYGPYLAWGRDALINNCSPRELEEGTFFSVLREGDIIGSGYNVNIEVFMINNASVSDIKNNFIGFSSEWDIDGEELRKALIQNKKVTIETNVPIEEAYRTKQKIQSRFPGLCVEFK